MHSPPTLPENISRVSTLQGGGNGVRIDVTGFHCVGPVLHQLRYGGETRLSVVLEEVGGRCEPRLRPNRPNPIEHMPRHMHFAPAGLEMWGHTADARFVKDATLTFDLPLLGERLETIFPRDLIDVPCLRFADDRVWTLVQLLAEAVGNPDPSMQLYCDGLTTAITARLFAPRLPPLASEQGLAPWRSTALSSIPGKTRPLLIW